MSDIEENVRIHMLRDGGFTATVEPTSRNTLCLVEELRNFARLLELYGPRALQRGGIAFDRRESTVNLNGDMTLCTLDIEHPRCGVLIVTYEGFDYQWDGQPRRIPRKGEFYLDESVPVLAGVVIRRARHLTWPKFIFNTVTV